MSDPASAPQPRRITRLARKPIKIASSALRPLRSGTATPTPSSVAAAGMGAGGSASVSSQGGNSLEPSSSISSLNPLKRITSRNRSSNPEGELDGNAIVKSVRGPRKPLDGEEPAGMIRVRVVKAEGLIAKDRNGLSDPYVYLPFAQLLT